MTAAVDVRHEGVRVGLIASASVAVFYALFDLLAARGPLHTVNLLGKALFRGERDASILMLPIPRDAGAILLYTGLHVVLSLVIGFVVTRLVTQGEREPSQAPLMLFLVVAGFVATILTVGLLTAPLRPLLPWWSIAVANAVAVLFAATYLLARHPRLWRRHLSPTR